MRFSLTVSIFTVILVVGLALALSIVGYSYTRQKEAAFVSIMGVMERSAEVLQLRTQVLVSPIDQVARRSTTWPGVTREPNAAGHPSYVRMIELLRAHPQIAAISIGYQTGSYYMVATARSRAQEELENMSAPPETVFIERVIERGENGNGLPLTKFIAEDGSVLGSTYIGARDYDPRTRPWYQSVWSGAREARSQVYLFHGSQKPGLTVSQRHETGVVGVDITLREMEMFLERDELAKDGVLAVIGSQGEILAQAGRTAENTEVLPTLTQILRDRPDFRSGPLRIGGANWIAHVDPAPFGEGTRETLALAMPVRALAAPIIVILRNALIVSLAIAIVSVPLIWLVSRSLSRPLVRLAKDADRIRRFDLSESQYKPSRVDEIHQLQTSIARMITNLGIFTSYVPKDLVKTFLEQGKTAELGGENRYITVLFMDIENFTAMAADLAPEETMRRMSDLFEVVTQILLAHGATIDKYIGDAVMAFWNAPEQVEDHEALACRAALAMKEAATQEIAKWDVHGLPLRPRIGVNCGEAIVGNVGSSDRMNYTALGATVNLAARLEAANRDLGTDILISPALVSRLEGRVETKAVGQVSLKGYKEPVAIFELLRMT